MDRAPAGELDACRGLCPLDRDAPEPVDPILDEEHGFPIAGPGETPERMDRPTGQSSGRSLRHVLGAQLDDIDMARVADTGVKGEVASVRRERGEAGFAGCLREGKGARLAALHGDEEEPLGPVQALPTTTSP
jgi:hypothetical protein